MSIATTVNESGVLVVTDGPREVLRIDLAQLTADLDAEGNANLARIVDVRALTSAVIQRLLGEADWYGYDGDLHRSREEILAGIGKVHAETVEQITSSRLEAWREAWRAHDIVNNYATLLGQIVREVPADKAGAILSRAEIRVHERAAAEYARVKALAAENGVNVEGLA